MQVYKNKIILQKNSQNRFFCVYISRRMSNHNVLEENVMKKGISLLLASAMLMGTAPAVSAETASAASLAENVVTPRYQYTTDASSEIIIASNTATLTSNITGKYGTATKIEVTQTLQIKDGNQWRRCTSWSNAYNTYRCKFVNNYTLSARGTYRTMTEAKVYSGSNYETVYAYSEVATY